MEMAAGPESVRRHAGSATQESECTGKDCEGEWWVVSRVGEPTDVDVSVVSPSPAHVVRVSGEQ